MRFKNSFHVKFRFVPKNLLPGRFFCESSGQSPDDSHAELSVPTLTCGNLCPYLTRRTLFLGRHRNFALLGTAFLPPHFFHIFTINSTHKKMSLEEKINSDLKAAMLSKNEAALRALRAVKSAILLAKTSGSGEVKAEDEIKILQKLVKQRKESVDIYKQQNREDLAKSEIEEIEVIEKYLPKMMSEEKIKAGIQAIITQVGAKGPGDLGKVMGAASKNFAGKADNKLVSQLVKELLTAM